MPEEKLNRHTLPKYFTPSPWRVTAVDWDADGFVRFTMNFKEFRVPDARVFGAAPDLYEALSMTRGQWIHSVNAPACLAALAKVEESE